MGIPAKANTDSERNANSISGPKTNSARSVATLALRLCSKCSASSRKTYRELSGAQRRKAPVAEKGVRGKGRQPFSLPSLQRPRRASARRLRAALFAHRVAAHLEAVRVVNQAVKNAVGSSGIADLLVPARDW